MFIGQEDAKSLKSFSSKKIPENRVSKSHFALMFIRASTSVLVV